MKRNSWAKETIANLARNLPTGSWFKLHTHKRISLAFTCTVWKDPVVLTTIWTHTGSSVACLLRFTFTTLVLTIFSEKAGNTVWSVKVHLAICQNWNKIWYIVSLFIFTHFQIPWHIGSLKSVLQPLRQCPLTFSQTSSFTQNPHMPLQFLL